MTTQTSSSSTTSGADGEHATGSVPSRMLWGTYVVLILALGVGRTIEKILADSGGLLSRYGPAAGAVVVAIGVAGYALSRRIGWRWMWQGVFVLTLLGCAGLLALEFIVITTDDAPWRIHLMILAGAVLLVPAQFALFRYAFRQPDIWQPADSP